MRAILAQGGNAIDAAVATAFAVGVVQPFSAGVGGGAFALVRLEDGTIRALDARETAPAKATPTMYKEPDVPERASVHGPLAVATPSFVPGMVELLEKHGTMSLPQVLAPAIELARDGVEIGRYHARMAGFMRKRFSEERFPETWRIQFAPFDPAAMQGEVLVQADLAKSLELLARRGERVFRDGEVGRAIVAEVQRRGGILTLDDLRAVEPKWRDPVLGEYRGHRDADFPPPSSGGAVLVQALNVLEGFDLSAHRAGDASAIHLVTEAMKLAFADRAAYMGDADFVDVPVARLVSKDYAKAQRARIDGSKATRIKAPGLIPEDAGTTHLSVTDAAGRAVALHDDDQHALWLGDHREGDGRRPQQRDGRFRDRDRDAQQLRADRHARRQPAGAGKRPLSSMTPTIVDRDGRLFMVSGSPGGSRIISTTLLTLLNVIDWSMDPQAAAAAPRYHHQWDPDKLRVEPETPAEVIYSLEERGHTVERSPRHWSAAEVIVDVEPETGRHLGGADPRTDGAAIGVSTSAYSK